MSNFIVIPGDCDLHETYTHGRSHGDWGGPLGHGPQWVKILKEIGPYVGRCLAAAHTWSLPIENPGYTHGYT